MKCIDCESKNVVKNGKRSGEQRYRCNDCGRQFNSLKPSKRKTELTKRLALTIYEAGLSLRDVAETFNVSHKTVHNWIRSAGSFPREESESKTKEKMSNHIEYTIQLLAGKRSPKDVPYEIIVFECNKNSGEVESIYFAKTKI